MLRKIHSSFRNQARDLVARNQRRVEKIIGKSYMFGDGLLMVIPAAQNGFLNTVMHMQPAWQLFERAYVERPLPVLVSGLWILGGVAIHRGRFALSNMFVTAATAAFMGDLFRSGEYFSIAPLVPNLMAGIIGTFHKSLEQRFRDSKSAFLRKTLGQPKSTTGKLYCAASYPILATSLMDANYPLFTSAIAWSTGSTLMALLPSENSGPVSPPPCQPQAIKARAHTPRR